ncbi:hypothetical protein HDU86_000398 [Geranomyces michiganensis]|nr:hypothetical protein HDU86_000398 [Geranomyces michiganensis]
MAPSPTSNSKTSRTDMVALMYGDFPDDESGDDEDFAVEAGAADSGSEDISDPSDDENEPAGESPESKDIGTADLSSPSGKNITLRRTTRTAQAPKKEGSEKSQDDNGAPTVVASTGLTADSKGKGKAVAPDPSPLSTSALVNLEFEDDDEDDDDFDLGDQASGTDASDGSEHESGIEDEDEDNEDNENEEVQEEVAGLLEDIQESGGLDGGALALGLRSGKQHVASRAISASSQAGSSSTGASGSGSGKRSRGQEGEFADAKKAKH